MFQRPFFRPFFPSHARVPRLLLLLALVLGMWLLIAPSASARTIEDLPYGPDRRQRMDVYLPAQPKAASVAAPVILMVHGGAWRIGNKTMGKVTRNKVARWVDKGFIFVSINYRLLPDANPLEQADDVARAVAAAQAAAPGWGGDPKRFILMGHSAGAHLVALLNAAPARATALGAQPWLGTVALDSAVMDVTPVMRARHMRFYDEAFGSDPKFWAAASPQQQWTAGVPPLLAVCSTQRPDRPCAAAERLSRHAAGLGGRVEVLGQDRTHAQINDELGLPGPYTDAVEAFLKSLDPAVAALLR
ncbi:alpha/beta hydrolase [Variovorax sp. VNK109]|jgi:arylformamidase|uniref:alpha/beta hydrolase n=1 Tax=Variovorax sp. VNK109 TaxID=3400919 RepID=UPI003C0BD01E